MGGNIDFGRRYKIVMNWFYSKKIGSDSDMYKET